MQVEILESQCWSFEVLITLFPLCRSSQCVLQVLTWHTHIHPLTFNFDCIIIEMLQALGFLPVCIENSSIGLVWHWPSTQGSTRRITIQQGEGAEMSLVWRWVSLCSSLAEQQSLPLSTAPWRPINLRTRCPTFTDLSRVVCDLHILPMSGLLQRAVGLQLSFWCLRAPS